jgi:hypothetical protein
MKITSNYLQKLIREEMAHPRDNLGSNVADVEFPIAVGYEGKSEIAYDQDELDDILDDIAPRGIKYSLDSLEDMEPSDRPVGAAIEQFGEAMKITKNQISRIVEHVLVEIAAEERMHRCFDGSLVAFGSNECLEDLHQRKDDAQDTRNSCNVRTDKRDYYNGVLKVLRRELRDAEKINGAMQPEIAEEEAF